MRYRFGTTIIEQQVIDDALVRRYMRYEQDEPFDMTEILRTQFALDDSQYFSTVEVLPGDPDRDQHLVPVSIHANANRRNRYSVGAGYGTDTSVRGTLQWEDRRINTSGHRFQVELKASKPQKSLESHYIIPIGDPALERLAFETSYEQQQLADLDTDDTLRHCCQHDHEVGGRDAHGHLVDARHQCGIHSAGVPRRSAVHAGPVRATARLASRLRLRLGLPPARCAERAGIRPLAQAAPPGER
jgi:outer membrane translocation and assembly module TamA